MKRTDGQKDGHLTTELQTDHCVVYVVYICAMGSSPPPIS